jgi:hypothetical protein
MKFDIWVFFENLSREFKFGWNVTRITGTSHEDLCIFMILILSRVLLRMTYISDRSCRENQNTRFLLKSCRLWDNVKKKYGGSRVATEDNVVRRMLVACWIRLLTHTQNMYYLLLFQGNSGYANAPQFCVVRALPVLLKLALLEI